MALFKWLRCKMSSKYQAGLLLRQAIRQARAGNNEAALQGYCDVIDMPKVSRNTLAMALFNRALLVSASGNDDAAIQDLDRVIHMEGVSEKISTEARRKITRMSNTEARSKTSREDC